MLLKNLISEKSKLDLLFYSFIWNYGENEQIEYCLYIFCEIKNFNNILNILESIKTKQTMLNVLRGGAQHIISL